MSDNSDQAVLRRAIRVGAREFFNKPVDDEEIELFLENENPKKDITIASISILSSDLNSAWHL